MDERETLFRTWWVVKDSNLKPADGVASRVIALNWGGSARNMPDACIFWKSLRSCMGSAPVGTSWRFPRPPSS